MAECITPFTMKNKFTNESQAVPCGQCPTCRKRRASAWSFRLTQEEKRSTSAHFITLTYDTTNVPISPRGFMSLDFRDVQLFFKRLRKLHGKGPQLKYYLVGEYGGKSYRPHYHIILFNLSRLSDISNAWNKGEVHYGQVTGASVGYTLKYISKPWKPFHQNDDRTKPKALMSKGLGSNYVTPRMVKFHKSDKHTHMYCVTQDGKKIAMPRYYKDKIYSPEERKAIAAKALALKDLEITKQEQRNPDFHRNNFFSHKQQFAIMHKADKTADKL